MSTVTKKSTTNLGTYDFDPDLQLEVHICGECGVVFGIEKKYMQARRKDGRGWACPNGHSWFWNLKETEVEKLRREKKNLDARLARERDRAGRLAAERDQVTASLRATKRA